MYSRYGNQYGDFSENWELFYLKIQYPNETASYHKDICSTMFTAVLFIIARNLKQCFLMSLKRGLDKKSLQNGVLLSS